MQRVAAPEWLDSDQGTPQQVRLSLEDLWRINRWLGGVAGCRRLLKPFLQAGQEPLRILEVGAGGAHLAARLRQQLRSADCEVEYVVSDRSVAHLRASEPLKNGLWPLAAEAPDLPFAPGAFDVVLSNLFLHHFSDEQAVRVLKGMAHVARRAVLVNDLERHWLPYVFIRFAPFFARSPITRHDGPASVRQAYTKDELKELAAAAGFSRFSVVRMPWFRLGLVAWV